uniref:Uncharacterized protein n=1 Tax=Arundo donax TaxID=35708 RepID=A0A0A9HQ37_ARUDO
MDELLASGYFIISLMS